MSDWIKTATILPFPLYSSSAYNKWFFWDPPKPNERVPSTCTLREKWLSTLNKHISIVHHHRNSWNILNWVRPPKAERPNKNQSIHLTDENSGLVRVLYSVWIFDETLIPRIHFEAVSISVFKLGFHLHRPIKCKEKCNANKITKHKDSINFPSSKLLYWFNV